MFRLVLHTHKLQVFLRCCKYCNVSQLAQYVVLCHGDYVVHSGFTCGCFYHLCRGGMTDWLLLLILLMLSQNFFKMYCIPPYQRRIQKFCKRGGVREAVFQLRHTLSQMPKVNYTHFIREKATYWREKKGYWSQLVGSAPPLFPGLIGHWCVLSLVTPLLVVCYDQYQRFMYCLCHSSLVIATLLPFSCSICLKQ